MPVPARYRAPAESGQKLVVPPWSELADLLADNQQWRRRTRFAMLGQPLDEFAASAREEILSLAASPGHLDATQATRSPVGPAASTGGPLIMTGHQPGLIHPGVWLKNFAVAHLAVAYGGVGLHVTIDADLCRSTAILVPSGSVATPRFALVEFDGPAPTTAWEERRIADPQRWQSFPQRVAEASGGLLTQRFLDEWWPAVVDLGAATGRVGAALSQARSAAEAGWNHANLELPQSRMCQSRAFRRFALALLVDLPRFVAAYNGALADYRRLHGLRNHAQPVPDLAANGPWLEAPFWIWTTADPRRRPLFVRTSADGLLASDRQGWERQLRLTGPADAEAAIAELDAWEAAGVKLRSRALVTTMFIRLALADLFFHGIGGAKYDEVTDAIVQRFFGAAPPRFAVMTGTLRLPIDQPAVDADEARRLRTALREMQFHPERRLAFDRLAQGPRHAAEALRASKTAWIDAPKNPRSAAERHQGIVAANAGLREFVADDRAALERRLELALEQGRARGVLGSREYASCLFPRKLLEQFFLDFRLPAR